MMLQRFLAVWADMPTTHRQLAISSVLMTFLLIWAFVAPLDVVSNAIGEVLPMTRVKSVQHLEGGTVTEILVREGDGVEQDQPLVLLDPVRADSEFEELTARLQSLNIDRLRLEAEIAGKAAPGFSEQLRQENPQRVIQAEETFDALGHFSSGGQLQPPRMALEAQSAGLELGFEFFEALFNGGDG